MNLILRKPIYKDETSYIEFFKEWFQVEAQKDVSDEDLRVSFVKFMYELPLNELGLINPEKRMPQVTYFLVDDQQHILGILDLRLVLNEHLFTYEGHIGYKIKPSERHKGFGKEILRLALEQAKALEFKEVLVTANEENIASLKIIEACGGVFENKVYKTDGYIHRYWIKL